MNQRFLVCIAPFVRQTGCKINFDFEIVRKFYKRIARERKLFLMCSHFCQTAQFFLDICKFFFSLRQLISKKLIRADRAKVCQRRKNFYVGITSFGFPTRYRLRRNAYSGGKGVLCDIIFLAKFFIIAPILMFISYLQNKFCKLTILL